MQQLLVPCGCWSPQAFRCQGWQEKLKLDEKQAEKGRMKLLTVLDLRKAEYIMCIERKKGIQGFFNKH